jgi:Rieske Fe-S protein
LSLNIKIKNISEDKKPVRREFLFTALYTLGAVGVGAVVWPLIDQMNPDASVKAVSTTEIDIGNIELGKTVTVLWRGKPVVIRKRTKLDIECARKVNLEELKDPEKDKIEHKSFTCNHLATYKKMMKIKLNVYYAKTLKSGYWPSTDIFKKFDLNILKTPIPKQGIMYRQND